MKTFILNFFPLEIGKLPQFKIFQFREYPAIHTRTHTLKSNNWEIWMKTLKYKNVKDLSIMRITLNK